MLRASMKLKILGRGHILLMIGQIVMTQLASHARDLLITTGKILTKASLVLVDLMINHPINMVSRLGLTTSHIKTNTATHRDSLKDILRVILGDLGKVRIYKNLKYSD